MKILYITNDGSLYGANRALLTLIKKVKARGYKVEVLLSRHGEIEIALRDLNIKYYIFKTCTWVKYNSDAKWKTPLRKLFNKISFFYIGKRLQKEKYDIVHTNSSVTNLGIYLSTKWNVKHVWHIRENLDTYKLEYMYNDDYVTRAYSESDVIITISDFIKKYFLNRLNVSTKVVTIYDGVEKFEVKPITHDKCVFCTAGVITEYKNQYQVCKSIKKLVDNGYKNVLYYIVGGIQEKNYYDKIINFISDNNLQDYIVLTGHETNPNKYYMKSDVGIMASENEGFGLVTVEYMMSNLVVLGADSGATSEIICDGENGLLYNSLTENSLYEKMEWCINNLQNLQFIKKEAKRRALKKYESNIYANNIINIYENLENEKKSI